ncbi:hypothetical protein [Paraburkholderia graminis]|uniref:hypothetical protein n=1 Tax=Paraburkholderia graminis TaxID=60548 RepID=UPI0038B985F5
MMPPAGAHQHIEPVLSAAAQLGSASTLTFGEPSLASSTIAMGRMRRAIADGTAKPSAIAAFQKQAAARQRHTGAMIDRFLGKHARMPRCGGAHAGELVAALDAGRACTPARRRARHLSP